MSHYTLFHSVFQFSGIHTQHSSYCIYFVAQWNDITSKDQRLTYAIHLQSLQNWNILEHNRNAMAIKCLHFSGHTILEVHQATLSVLHYSFHWRIFYVNKSVICAPNSLRMLSLSTYWSIFFSFLNFINNWSKGILHFHRFSDIWWKQNTKHGVPQGLLLDPMTFLNFHYQPA